MKMNCCDLMQVPLCTKWIFISFLSIWFQLSTFKYIFQKSYLMIRQNQIYQRKFCKISIYNTNKHVKRKIWWSKITSATVKVACWIETQVQCEYSVHWNDVISTGVNLKRLFRCVTWELSTRNWGETLQWWTIFV